VVEYDAEREGASPSVPPAELGPNYALLARHDGFEEEGLASDGLTVSKKRHGWMIFGVADPAKVVMGAPIPPWAIDQLRQMRSSGDAQTASGVEQMLAAASVDDPVEPGIFAWKDMRPPEAQQGGPAGGENLG